MWQMKKAFDSTPIGKAVRYRKVIRGLIAIFRLTEDRKIEVYSGWKVDADIDEYTKLGTYDDVETAWDQAHCLIGV